MIFSEGQPVEAVRTLASAHPPRAARTGYVLSNPSRGYAGTRDRGATLCRDATPMLGSALEGGTRPQAPVPFALP